jgi:hypothetical protein
MAASTRQEFAAHVIKASITDFSLRLWKPNIGSVNHVDVTFFTLTPEAS